MGVIARCGATARGDALGEGTQPFTVGDDAVAQRTYLK